MIKLLDQVRLLMEVNVLPDFSALLPLSGAFWNGFYELLAKRYSVAGRLSPSVRYFQKSMVADHPPPSIAYVRSSTCGRFHHIGERSWLSLHFNLSSRSTASSTFCFWRTRRAFHCAITHAFCQVGVTDHSSSDAKPVDFNTNFSSGNSQVSKRAVASHTELLSSY